MPRRTKARKPIVMFCDLRRASDEIINISSQNGAEGVVTQMLPKSHISHVILNANVSEERFLDMKVSTENKMQKKSRDVHDHFINTFKMRLERKQNRWMKEDNYVSKNLNIMASPRRPMSVDFTDGYPETLLATPQSIALYRPAKYPYSAITARQKISHENTPSPQKMASRSQTSMNINRLPQIPPSRSGARHNQHSAVDKPERAVGDKVKLPQANGSNNIVGRAAQENSFYDSGRRRNNVSANWTSRATTTQRSRGRKVGFKMQDERFESLMQYLSPVWDKHSLRSGPDIFTRMDSAMSKASSRLVASRS
ncbi:uncharacterized protein LOC120348275 [Styela clava]